MKDFACTLGSSKNGLILRGGIGENSVLLQSATLLLYDCSQPIEITNEVLKKHLEGFVLAEYTRQQKYRRIEKAFKEHFGETIDIQNEDAYSSVLYEWNKRTEDDTRMNDLNGDLKAF